MVIAKGKHWMITGSESTIARRAESTSGREALVMMDNLLTLCREELGDQILHGTLSICAQDIIYLFSIKKDGWSS